MRDRAEEIIENVISTWLGDNWERLGELAKDPDSASKLHRLQDYYREADIPALTRAEFVDLLRSSIWFLISGDEIRSPQVTALLLQTCLTLGEHNAILLAQQAAGMKITDGIMGPQTLEAINRINPEEFIANYTRLAENSQSMNTMPPQDTASPLVRRIFTVISAQTTLSLHNRHKLPTPHPNPNLPRYSRPSTSTPSPRRAPRTSGPSKINWVTRVMPRPSPR